MTGLENDFLTTFLTWLESLSRSASGVLDAVRAIDPSLRMLVAGVAVMLQNFLVTGLIVPANTVVFLAASTIAGPTEGALLAVMIAVGGLMGQTASYGLGRWAGTSAWSERSRRRESSRIAAAHRFLLRRGGPAILGARFVPVLRVIMPFAVGLSGFSFRRFLAWSAAASVIWSAVYVSTIAVLSASLRDESGSPVIGLGLSLLGFAAFGAAYAVQFVVERARRRSRTTGTHSPDPVTKER